MTSAALPPLRVHTRTLTVADIEAALDALLAAIEADAAREIDGHPVNVDILSLAEIMRTEPDVFRVAELAENPVGRSCRESIKSLGKALFRVGGSTDAMREVMERVAERSPAKRYRRLNLLDKWWNGIGAGADVWCS